MSRIDSSCVGSRPADLESVVERVDRRSTRRAIISSNSDRVRRTRACARGGTSTGMAASESNESASLASTHSRRSCERARRVSGSSTASADANPGPKPAMAWRRTASSKSAPPKSSMPTRLADDAERPVDLLAQDDGSRMCRRRGRRPRGCCRARAERVGLVVARGGLGLGDQLDVADSDAVRARTRISSSRWPPHAVGCVERDRLRPLRPRARSRARRCAATVRRVQLLGAAAIDRRRRSGPHRRCCA